MLLLAKHMLGAAIEAADGKLGKLCDLVFDERNWQIEKLVIDAGTWLHRRRVTLPPDMLREKDWADHRLAVTGLTRQQVVSMPGAETHVPFAGQKGLEEATIEDWQVYWTDMLYHPWQIADDPRLHNTQEVTGYYIQATDGPIGHLADFVIDDQTWAIRHLVVDTRNWWPGKHVLIPPARVDSIDGHERMIRLLLGRDTIEQCPQANALGMPERPDQTTPAGHSGEWVV